MSKNFLITIFVAFILNLTAAAQDYSRYYYFYDEAIKLMNAGNFDDAKTKFISIKENLNQGGLPPNNDLDQKIKDCTKISFSPNELKFESAGQTAFVAVSVNASNFSVSSNSRWCRAVKKQNGVSVSCDENTEANSRNAIVTVHADGKLKSFAVLQQGGELEFDIQPMSVNFSNNTDTASIYVATNAASWRTDLVPDWIVLDANENKARLTCLPNNTTEHREASILFCAADECIPVSVTQAGADTVFQISSSRLIFPSSVSDSFLVVNSNLNHFETHDSNDWIFSSVSNDTVRISVMPNGSLFSRKGSISFGVEGKKQTISIVQQAYVSEKPNLTPEIIDDDNNDDSFIVRSIPPDLKVIIKDELGGTQVRYTPFEMPVDFGHYTLSLGFEHKELFANKSQEVLFTPGIRFASVTWSPKYTVGMMSGFIGTHSWGACSHFQVNLPFVTDFTKKESGLAGYNFTVGPVFRPNRLPYIGLYAGIGAGGYAQESHLGLDYEAGLMGFYHHFMLTLGFHTSRMSSTVKNTNFMIGVGGYLKRYYDSYLGYCSSDSRRWVSLNYVFRPSENGKGVMIGDMGRERLRTYIKALYLTPDQMSDSIAIKNIDASFGFLFTPVDGFIDFCIGASGGFNISGLDNPLLGVGLELGTVLNIWRFPITVFLHESDLFGNHKLIVDFGVGFHLGKFGKSNCSYL